MPEKGEEIARLMGETKSYSVFLNLVYLDTLLESQSFQEYFVAATGFIHDYGKFFFAKTVDKHVVSIGLPSWKAFLEKVFFSSSFLFLFPMFSRPIPFLPGC